MAMITHPSHPGHVLELVPYLSDGRGSTYRCAACNYDLYILAPTGQGMEVQNVPVRRRTRRLKRVWKVTKILAKGTIGILTFDPTQFIDAAGDVVDLFRN